MLVGYAVYNQPLKPTKKSSKKYHVDPKNWCEYDDFTQWCVKLKYVGICTITTHIKTSQPWTTFPCELVGLTTAVLTAASNNQGMRLGCMVSVCFCVCENCDISWSTCYMLHHFTSFYQMFHYFSNCIRLFCWGPIAVSFIAAIWASSQSRPETRPRT